MLRRGNGFTLRHAGSLAAVVLLLWFATGLAKTPGTVDTPIIDSALTPHEAIYSNQPPGTPAAILDSLALVDVLYYSFDGVVHRGQLVVHQDLVDDIVEIFDIILKTGYPVYSVMPIAHPEIQKKGPYGLSPDTDNSSAFVYRPVVGGTNLSMHAAGRAVDLNPRQNPYIRGDLQLPPHSSYDPDHPATLTPGHPVVEAFTSRGWTWGGDWHSKGLVDYMHFEKPAPRAPLKRYDDKA